MHAHWDGLKKAIAQALDNQLVDPQSIAAIGVTGHGDGLYLLDDSERPLRNAILSLDSRGVEAVNRWRESGVLDQALSLTGQHPYPAAPSALLAWLKSHHPEDYRRIRWVLLCKDWIRYKLTGKIATDFTEASLSFTNVHSQSYDESALTLFDLPEIADSLPEALSPTSIAGEIHQAAADETGLAVGTPVVTGLHDVTASAIGMGGTRVGQLSIIAGTFSINEVMSNRPQTSPAWCCRNGLKRGQWMNMSISPASSANIDWFINTNCKDALALARQNGEPVFNYLEDEMSAAFSDDSRIVYHPFLYGSPHGDLATAGFLGLQAWHGRGHLLRAVLEGVVFNHRYHVAALRSAFPCHTARLSGGSSKNPRVCQLFADTIGMNIEIVDAQETGALGAAMCAAVGVSIFASLEAAAQKMIRVHKSYRPDSAKKNELEESYQRYLRTVAALSDQWPNLIIE